MEQGGNVRFAPGIDNVSAKGSLNSVSTFNNNCLTARRSADGLDSEVSGNLSSSSCESLFERRLKNRLAKAENWLGNRNLSCPQHPLAVTQNTPHEYAFHQSLRNRNINCSEERARRPSLSKSQTQNQNYCCDGVQNENCLSSSPNHNYHSPRHLRQEELLQESEPLYTLREQRRRRSSSVKSSQRDLAEWLIKHHRAHQEEPEEDQKDIQQRDLADWLIRHHREHHDQQHQDQKEGQQRDHAERIVRHHRVHQEQEQQEQTEVQQRLQRPERRHSCSHNPKRSQYQTQSLERRRSFSRHLNHQKTQQPLPQQMPSPVQELKSIPHFDQQTLRQQQRLHRKYSVEERHHDPQSKSPQHKPHPLSKMNHHSLTDNHQHDDWLDTFPRTRLNTISGTDNYVSSSSTFCHTMSRLSITQRSHKRATSLKKPSKKPFDMGDLHGMRPRTSSLPTKSSFRRPALKYLSPPPCPLQGRDGDEFYTVRSFVTTSKGQLVNRGDSLRSRSTNSVISSGSGSVTELTHLSENSSQTSLSQGGGGGGSGGGGGGSGGGAEVFAPDSPAPPSPYRVLILGSQGVGKSSLTEQFSTSEYLGALEQNVDAYREQNVSLLIDGEESTVDFLDSAVDANALTDLTVDGFVIVFSMDSRSTFSHATDILYDLRKAKRLDSAIILVANKCDLVRSREVSTEEAKSVAATYDCKYVETSVVLNHNVDELLVGIVTQMRLMSEDKDSNGKPKYSASVEPSCYGRGKHLLNKLFRKYPISKSCENLYVL